MTLSNLVRCLREALDLDFRLPLFSAAQAKMIGDHIGVDWSKVSLEQFRRGLHVEMEHGLIDPQTNVTDNDVIKTGKIALIHLKERPDYYTRLQRAEH